MTTTELDPLRDLFSGKRFPALDGLRLIAMLEVVRYHAGQTPLLDGVQCFFVLSGFLFAALLDREFTRTGTIGLKAFYQRRIRRIFPAFLVAVAVTIAFKLALRLPVDFVHAFASVTCWANIYNILHDHPATGFSSYWTLAVEQQFYLLFPPFLLLCLRSGGRRAAAMLLIALAVVSAGWRILGATVFDFGSAYLYNAFETRIDQFAWGALFGLAVSSDWFLRVMAFLAARPWSPVVTFAALLVMSRLEFKAWQFGVSATVASPLLALLIVQLIALSQHRAWRWLEHPWVVYGGTLSYSAYLYHHLGLAFGHRVPMISTLAGIAMTFLLAALSYHWVERPGRSRRSAVRARLEPAT